jgi:Ca-activated chloride channel family protein
VLDAKHATRQPLMVFVPFMLTIVLGAQTYATVQGSKTYGLSITVDEVGLTFHAADAHGLPINDLRPEELSVVDDGKPPRGILTLQTLRDRQIRAGILIDTSESMGGYLPRNRAIAVEYAQSLLRQKTDQAFVMDFNYVSKIAQPWTGSPIALSEGIRKFVGYGAGRVGGTAVVNAVYQACLNQFGRIDNAATGNFILLFSDGEDNASKTDLRQAIDICQRVNTAVYSFRVKSQYALSSGRRTLEDLASETGGRVFYNDESDVAIYKDLLTIEADLRNEYYLVYKPTALKHDGKYHTIIVETPDRVQAINVRSGYYAPSR